MVGTAWAANTSEARWQHQKEKISLRNHGGINWYRGGLGAGHVPVPDFEWAPDAETVELRITSSHLCGRILNWRIVSNKGRSVADLLQAVARRSRWTSVPLEEQGMVLVELLHNRLIKRFPSNMRLDRLGSGRCLAIYELPPMPSDATVYQKPTLVACHVRLPRDASTYFAPEGSGEVKELCSAPLLFEVPPGISEANLYAFAHAGFYRPRTAVTFSTGVPAQRGADVCSEFRAQTAAFQLFICKSSKQLSDGGLRVDPHSGRPAQVEISEDRGAILLVAEWPRKEEPAPWVRQQLEGPSAGTMEFDMDVVVGVNVMDLCRHIRALKREHEDLAQEVKALRASLVGARFEATATEFDSEVSESEHRSERVDGHLRRISQRLLLEPQQLCKRFLLQDPRAHEAAASAARPRSSTRHAKGVTLPRFGTPTA